MAQAFFGILFALIVYVAFDIERSISRYSEDIQKKLDALASELEEIKGDSTKSYPLPMRFDE